MSKLKLGAIIFVTFIFGVGVGSLGSKSSTTGKVSSSPEEIKQTTTQSGSEVSIQASPQQTSESQGKVEVKSHTKKVDYGYPKIVGEVVNNTQNPTTFVKVTATFYDNQGKVIGTSFTYAGDTASTPLAPKTTAPFEITDISQKNFDTYKLDVNWH